MSRAYHLNLLRDSERVSSSPVRLRVMVPVAALLACAAMIIWWSTLAGQSLLVQSNLSRLRDTITARQTEHKAVLDQMAHEKELAAQFAQLEGYRLSCRPWGDTLRLLAETMPLKVQLTHLAITTPTPAPAVKGQPPPPPPRTRLVLAGRAPRETPIISLMESLESETFTNALVILKDPRSPDQSPRVKSFRQEAAAHDDGPRFLAFEIEYLTCERRFLK